MYVIIYQDHIVQNHRKGCDDTLTAWRYTNLKCRECNSIVVQDIWKLEYYCLNCGLIHEGVTDEDNTYTRMQDNLQ